MKLHTLALAATLAFAGTAFAAPNEAAPAAASPKVTHVAKVKHHAKKHTVHHQAKAVQHTAVKRHTPTTVTRGQQLQDQSASAPSDVNSGSRSARMEEALQKSRATRG